MNNKFFPKLAADNIKKNSKTYIPYIVTCIVTVSVFYIIKSLSLNPGLTEMIGAQTLSEIMFLGSIIDAIFSLIFLFYTNSFLIKRRKKEFAVFNILGMEKKHISITLAWENLYVTLISLFGGVVLGIALDKVMFLVITKMLKSYISLGFFISKTAILSTVIIFIAIFILIYINTIRQIHISNPVDLLKEGNVGEKEPKSKLLIAILGAICLIIGYSLALTTKNPTASVFVFFVAVLFVIAGTYMLFTSGSIVLLKSLRKNKDYYYKTKHFTSISGMIYRMKQNAVGLANICILSTMVLVMISSTSSLMIGMEEINRNRYPNDISIYVDETSIDKNQEQIDLVKDFQKKNNIEIAKEQTYKYLAFSGYKNGDSIDAGFSPLSEVLFFVPLSDYNEAMGTNKTLNENEVLLYSNRSKFKGDTLKVLDKEYKIKEKLNSFLNNGIAESNVASTKFIVVPDMNEFNDVYHKQKETLKEFSKEIRTYYGFDVKVGEDEKKEIYNNIENVLKENYFNGTIETNAQARESFMGLYGGFFFIGLFLGALFIMATVLIIYYKQISEGYEDKERFEIMQKVGMSHQEVKSSIRSQVLTVFFLPLVVAGIHISVAFPIIKSLLAILGLYNVGLYAICTIVSFVIFAIMYVIVYLLTSKVYYKIVSR